MYIWSFTVVTSYLATEKQNGGSKMADQKQKNAMFSIKCICMGFLMMRNMIFLSNLCFSKWRIQYGGPKIEKFHISHDTMTGK